MPNSEPVPSSAQKALRLVSLLGERGRLRVVDAARELDVAASSAHRLLLALCREGFAAQDEDRSYVRGPAFAELGPLSATRRLQAIVSSHLAELTRVVGETTHLVVLDGTAARFIAGAEGPGALRVASRVGMCLPGHTTSGGKALLAELGEARVAELYADGVPHVTGARARTLGDLADELAQVRRQRYAMNIEESEPGIVAVGVCLRDRKDAPVAGLSIAVPSVRFRYEMVPGFVRNLHRTSARLRALS